MFLNFGNHTWTTGSAWCRRNLRDFFTSFILTRFISLLSTNIISSFSYVLLFYYTAESFLLVLPIWFNIIGKKYCCDINSYIQIKLQTMFVALNVVFTQFSTFQLMDLISIMYSIYLLLSPVLSYCMRVNVMVNGPECEIWEQIIIRKQTWERYVSFSFHQICISRRTVWFL